MHYLFLALAIFTEVLGTLALKASASFTQFWPSLIVVIGYSLSFYFLALTMEKIPIGITYAIWSAVGIVLIALMGYILYRQSLDMPAIVGMAFIVLGVLIMTGFSKSQVH